MPRGGAARALQPSCTESLSFPSSAPMLSGKCTENAGSELCRNGLSPCDPTTCTTLFPQASGMWGVQDHPSWCHGGEGLAVGWGVGWSSLGIPGHLLPHPLPRHTAPTLAALLGKESKLAALGSCPTWGFGTRLCPSGAPTPPPPGTEDPWARWPGGWGGRAAEEAERTAWGGGELCPKRLRAGHAALLGALSPPDRPCALGKR